MVVRERSITTVPHFESVDALRDAMVRRTRHEPVDLYPRDGTVQLYELESNIARLIGIDDPKKVIAYSSGMSALARLIESEAPTAGTVVLHAHDEYSRTRRYAGEILQERGARVVSCDTQDTEELKGKIEKYIPQIIILETVANGPQVPILDLQSLFSSQALRDANPLIILDNTMPTPTLIGPDTLLGARGLRVAVIESGMKAYSENVEMLGIVYAADPTLLDKLREQRITAGATPSYYQVEKLGELINESTSKRDFDSRNLRILGNTLQLAQGCYEAGNELVFIGHPNLPTNANSGYANRLFPAGASPLFFITPTKIDQFELSEVLWSNPTINAHCELGQSFGLDRTRIFPDLTAQTVRISGGIEDAQTIAELKSAFRHTIASIR